MTPDPVVPVDDGVPLTPTQQRLWTLAQVRPDDPFYTVPFVLDIDGPLDRVALERALTGLVSRHDALRLRIRQTAAGLVQHAVAAQPVALPVDDLTSLPVVDRDERAAALSAAFAAEPFSLGDAPLVRLRLLREAAHRHRLLGSVHHIAFDGVSLQVFATELVALYDAYTAGRPSPLGAPAPGYAAYLRDRTARDAQALPDQLRYWTRRLAGAPALLELPTAGPRPARARYEGARRTRLLPAALLGPLRRLARSQRCTTYMTLKAACDVLLHSYGGDDVLTGMALSGRDSAGSSGVVGYLARPVVLRSTFTGVRTFADLLTQVRNDVLDALDHPDLPFEAVLDALGTSRDPSWQPLFQVMVDCTAAAPPRTGGGVAFRLSELPLTSLKVDLSIGLIERADGLLGEIDYRTDLFDPADVDRMLARLETVLARIGADPDVAIADLVAPTEAELHAVLGPWSRGVAGEQGGGRGEPAAAETVHRLVERQVGRTPDAVAVDAAGPGGRRWSFRELDAAADRWAARLRELGVGLEDRVGICLPASAALPAVLLGVLKAGGTCVPLDSTGLAFQLRTVLDDTGARIVLADAASAALFDRTRVRIVEVDPAEPAGDTAPAAGVDVPPAAAAAVLYTSGWSGEPKPVVIEHANLAHTVARAGDAVPAGHLRTVPLAGAPTTIAALTSLLAGLAAGGTVTVPARRDRRPVGAWPLALPGDREYVRYGSVETAGVAMAGPRVAAEPAAVGRPLGHARAYVLDAGLRPVPPGAVGELHLGGPVVTRGYLEEPCATAERYLPDPFDGEGQRMWASGDLVRHGPDGRLQFVSRVGHRPVVWGFPVQPGDLEAAAESHPDVDRVCVLAASDHRSAPDGTLGLAVARRARSAVTPGVLRSYLARRLPGYLVPGAVVVLDELPLLPNGLPDPRAAAEALAAAEHDTGDEEPSGDTERIVADAWAAVLGSSVGLDHNFFEVGGNSLLLVRLRQELRTALDRDVDVVELFRHPTVRAMAAFLTGDGPAQLDAVAAATERGRARQEARRARDWVRHGERVT